MSCRFSCVSVLQSDRNPIKVHQALVPAALQEIIDMHFTPFIVEPFGRSTRLNMTNIFKFCGGHDKDI
ncbi:hypothetical protein PsorP6_001404 [Peronosclerospora sorghi]|uniref:Uncharacterized protein n=1 Tax=Peronosclerospora sorghi TaxID=230839 RepID=A0ACC0WW42_9STRA|nr:hypothetical protein PsorP6_001404 [Peronosclerospora sorghi]